MHECHSNQNDNTKYMCLYAVNIGIGKSKHKL